MKQFLILLALLSTIALNADDYRTIQRDTIVKANNGERHKVGDFGNYYALLIYVEKYQNLKNLRTPKKDVEAIAKILKSRYGFIETKIVPNPKNSDELIAVLDDFKNRLNSNDNLLIYYAGHGSKNGYWQLVNAKRRSRVGWISVKEAINQTLKEMRSKHILVVADSCYSGFLTRDGVSMSNLSPNDKRYYSKLYAMKSRNVLTSGSLQPVLDQDPTNPNHSVFANGFLKMLKKNSRAIFSLEEQYPKVKRYVRLNSEEQIPLYGDVKLTGHEDGGDFIFLDRKVISKTSNSNTVVNSVEVVPQALVYEYEPKMIHINKGNYIMGSNNGANDEKPPHKVTIDYDFEIGKYEVTIAEYKACVDDGGCKQPAWLEKGSKYNIHTGSDDYYKKMCLKDNCPAIGVSWNDAKAYTKWLSKKTGKNYRLPTEAEWEYVARAGTTTKWSFGDNKNSLTKYAWYTKNSNGKTHQVGTKKANPWGVYDMHGNVWEWCEDWYLDSYNSTPRNGSANQSQKNNYKVLRSGSWFNIANNTRSVNREGYYPASRYRDIGFRLQRTLP